MNMSLIELWSHMGWFARGIVFLLLGMSVYMLTIAFTKWVQMARSRRATLAFSPQFSEALSSGDFAEAERLVEAHPRSHLASAFRRVFQNLGDLTRDGDLSAVDVGSVERTIELNTLEQLTLFRRGLSILATTGATAPFVGLLGTTIGVVNAFTGMANAGTGGLTAISAGIAEALITTAIGIGVALPAVWLYNYFLNRIEFISTEITYATKEFLDYVLRYEGNFGRRTGASAAGVAAR
ncbi:MAG TPA: MotA/TolQ/ExbB proton channel family protein [Longimicrobiales bacterium]